MNMEEISESKEPGWKVSGILGPTIGTSLTTKLCVLTIRSPEDKALVYSICQFPRCKYSHDGQFQATNITPLNLDWEESCTVSCALAHHCHQRNFPDSPLEQEPWTNFIDSLLFSYLLLFHISYFLLFHITHLGLLSLISLQLFIHLSIQSLIIHLLI